MDIRDTDALVVVDVQKVAGGDRVFEPINRIMPLFPYVVAARDLGIEETAAAEFSPKLDLNEVDEVLSKGMRSHSPGGSAFDATDLDERLHAREVRRVFVCGLATDYCVKATALEAAAHGYETYVVTDAVAAVNSKCTDEADALSEMASHSVKFATSEQLAPRV